MEGLLDEYNKHKQAWGVTAVQHERKPVLGEAASTKLSNRSARVKPEPQQSAPETAPIWEPPESPSVEDQSSDSDLSDALTLARERLLISHALEGMAKLIGDVRATVYHNNICLFIIMNYL